MEDRILAYLARRAARPEHLADSLKVTANDIDAALDEMQRKAWITRGAAWYGNDPSTAITVIALTPAGRAEAAAREAAVSAESEEPLVMTRKELVEELRRLGMTEDEISMNPNLRGSRFHFWPSVPAWSVLTD